MKKIIQLTHSALPISKKTTLLFSGGLDSSILFKLLNLQDYSLNTVSTGFNFEKIDEIEKEYALSAANFFRIKHEHIEFSVKDLLPELISIIDITEEPVMNFQTVLLNLLFRKYRKIFFKNVISGQGADGVFGQSLQYSLFSGSAAMSNEVLINRGVDLRWFANIYGCSEKEIILNRFSRFYTMEKINNQDRLFMFDLLGAADITQTCWRKCARSNGIKIIYPFLDKELIRYVSSIIWDVKLKEPKYLLRQLARNLNINEEIITREKKSFGPVSIRWAKYLTPLISVCGDFFSKKFLQEIKNDPSKRYLFWNIVNYSIWKKIFINNQSKTDVNIEIFS